VAQLAALSIASEVGDWRRFPCTAYLGRKLAGASASSRSSPRSPALSACSSQSAGSLDVGFQSALTEMRGGPHSNCGFGTRACGRPEIDVRRHERVHLR
jgi:hypothetical protein